MKSLFIRFYTPASSEVKGHGLEMGQLDFFSSKMKSFASYLPHRLRYIFHNYIAVWPLLASHIFLSVGKYRTFLLATKLCAKKKIENRIKNLNPINTSIHHMSTTHLFNPLNANSI